MENLYDDYTSGQNGTTLDSSEVMYKMEFLDSELRKMRKMMQKIMNSKKGTKKKSKKKLKKLMMMYEFRQEYLLRNLFMSQNQYQSHAYPYYPYAPPIVQQDEDFLTRACKFASKVLPIATSVYGLAKLFLKPRKDQVVQVLPANTQTQLYLPDHNGKK